MRRALVAVALASVGVLATRADTPVTFTDITAPAGLRFVYNNGAFGKKYLPEMLGSGCLFLDFDGDGWPDILLINSSNWPEHPGAKSHPALYRNNHDGTFSDRTRGSGLDVELYGMGGTAADFDNDGLIDVYITAYGGGHLFRNLGGGKFIDVTHTAGVDDRGFSTSAMWFDYDKDGELDLFIAHYIDWTPQRDIYCTNNGREKSYCTPDSYKGDSPVLFHNRGDGTFENVTRAAGVFENYSKGLGVAMIDFDDDGWPDVFVANDTEPNRLYRNNHDGTFKDVAMRAGVAYSEGGAARAGMGVDAADYDGSGRPTLVIGNFSNEMMGLYHNEGHGLFIDEAPRSTIGKASLLSLTFGCFFFDYDLDGRLDVFAANGHIMDDVERFQSRVSYAQRPHLFHNLGQKRFEEVTAQSPGFQQPLVARGAAYADIDNDGDLDVLVMTNNGPAHLFRHDGGNANNVLRVRTIGTTSNRDGIGARVELSLAGGAKPWQIVKTGSSYASQSELPLTFGLGSLTDVAGIRVRWPSGRVDTLGATRANQTVVIKESAGIIRSTPINHGSR